MNKVEPVVETNTVSI